MNKFIAVTAIVVMTGISSYVLAQAAETKPAETKSTEAPAVTPVPATPAAPATATPPVVKPAAAAPVAVDTGAIASGMQGNVIILPRRGCEKRETGSIEINFQYSEDDVSALSKEIDAKTSAVKSEAVKAGATAELADMNYNVNAGRNYGGDGDSSKYHINGNMHFNVTPADKAVVLLQALSTSKDHVSLNYRMNGGNCGMIP